MSKPASLSLSQQMHDKNLNPVIPMLYAYMRTVEASVLGEL